MFERLARAIGQEWMLDDPRLNNYAQRDHYVDEVDGHVTDWTSTHTTNEVVAHFERHALPCGRVNTPADVLDNKVFRELGYIDEVIDGLGGSVRVPTSPLNLRRPGSAVPRQGQHSDEILAEVLARTTAEIDALRAGGVVQ
jgi:crotonobetainyl-CoA:carnitine CoA-transferase CaiB-like acyl-CoA transferase